MSKSEGLADLFDPEVMGLKMQLSDAWGTAESLEKKIVALIDKLKYYGYHQDVFNVETLEDLAKDAKRIKRTLE